MIRFISFILLLVVLQACASNPSYVLNWGGERQTQYVSFEGWQNDHFDSIAIRQQGVVVDALTNLDLYQDCGETHWAEAQVGDSLSTDCRISFVSSRSEFLDLLAEDWLKIQNTKADLLIDLFEQNGQELAPTASNQERVQYWASVIHQLKDWEFSKPIQNSRNAKTLNDLLESPYATCTELSAMVAFLLKLDGVETSPQLISLSPKETNSATTDFRNYDHMALRVVESGEVLDVRDKDYLGLTPNIFHFFPIIDVFSKQSYWIEGGDEIKIVRDESGFKYHATKYANFGLIDLKLHFISAELKKDISPLFGDYEEQNTVESSFNIIGNTILASFYTTDTSPSWHSGMLPDLLHLNAQFGAEANRLCPRVANFSLSFLDNLQNIQRAYPDLIFDTPVHRVLMTHSNGLFSVQYVSGKQVYCERKEYQVAVIQISQVVERLASFGFDF